jgi:hypothetical protein
VDEALVAKIARQAAGELSPMAAFIGGVVGQEIIKVRVILFVIRGLVRFAVIASHVSLR